MSDSNTLPKRKCAILNCNLDYSASGYCKKHYDNFKRLANARRSSRSALNKRKDELLLQVKKRITTK